MSSFEAHHRFARITARKARYVADLVRGQGVNRALDVLQHLHKRGSGFVERVVRSAIANATRDGNVNANRLFIQELQVDAGPLLQGRFRYQPGPMGRALPIRKRTSHIHVVLGEAPSEKAPPAKRARTEKAAGEKPSGAGRTSEGRASESAGTPAQSPPSKGAPPTKATPGLAAGGPGGQRA